ncbi:MAG: sulfite exporter TauE/SafE family protein [Erythrobacter sp.]
MDTAMIVETLASGAVIGFVLGLVGGGGSILAVPLLVYWVGVESAHEAIGTAAVAVALNALIGLFGHARARNVKWNCALVFSASGVVGAALGAEAGKAMNGEHLLAAFGGLMVVVGALTIRGRKGGSDPDVRLDAASARRLLPRLVGLGLAVGLLAGFFGIGGGFLIVPGLIAATAMPIGVAVGSSLVVVSALGLTTSASYALSGYVDWVLVALLAAGGLVGSVFGRLLGVRLAQSKNLLDRGFGAMVIAIGLFVILKPAG